MPETVLNIKLKQEAAKSPSVSDQNSWSDVTRRIAVDGDQEALAIYYDQYFETMFVIVRNTSGRDEQSCLDIVQEAMLKAIRCMKPMQSQKHLLAWTKAVAKSVTYDWLRKQTRQQKVEMAGAKSDRAVDKPSEHAASIDDQARLIWIEQQLRCLPNELQTMISLKYRMGWTLKQIGSKFGLKTGAVDGKIRRAIENIKSKADENSDNHTKVLK